MTNKKNVDYEKIFEPYELDNKHVKSSDGIKTAAKKQIRRKFHRIYGEDALWIELTDMQQQRFIYVTMKDYLLKVVDNINVRNNAKAKRIKKKIDKESRHILQMIDVQEQRNNISNKYYYRKGFYETIENSEEQMKVKKEDYKEFEKAFKQVLSPLNPPTFEEWDRQNQQELRCLNDYALQSVLDNKCNEQSDSDGYVDTTMPQAELDKRVNEETDHIVLQCLVKILEELGVVKINIDEIKNGIRALIYDTEILTSFIPVYDKLLFMSKEECAKEIDRMFEIDKDNPSENLSCEKKREYDDMQDKYASARELSEEDRDEENEKNDALYEISKKLENLDFYEFLGKYQGIADKIKDEKQKVYDC